MKKITIFTVLIVSFMISASAEAGFFTDRKLDKAEKLIEQNFTIEARAIIMETITDNPDDPDVYFRTGMLFLKMKEHDSMMKSFNAVDNLGSKKQKQEIAVVLSNLAFLRLEEAKGRTAQEYFEAAFRFDPSIKDSTVNEIMTIGKDYVSGAIKGIEVNKSIEKSFAYFYMASYLDKGQEKNIGEIYLNNFNESGYTKFALGAIDFDPSLKNEIVDAVTKLAKDETISKDGRKKVKTFLENLIGKDEFLKIFPYGEKDLLLKKTFTGIGFSGGKYNNGGIETLLYREDFFPGDTIIFSGKHVEVYVGGKYRKRNKMQINNVGDKKDYLYVRAPKGEKFTLSVVK